MLLHPDFTEFGSSGKVWGRVDTIEALAAGPSDEPDEPPVDVADMRTAGIAPGAFLVTYRSRRGDRAVLRSSTWVEPEGRLCVRWHQGTPTTDGLVSGE